MMHVRRLPLLALVLACHSGGISPATSAPPPPPTRWLPLIGEYGAEPNHYIVLERDRKLWLHSNRSELTLVESTPGVYFAENENQRFPVTFTRGANDRVVSLTFAGRELPAVELGPQSGNQLVITPVRPVADLRKEALAAHPPAEAGPFLPTDLVELTTLDSTIKLEIRYATSNNFLGTPFYTQGRAFLQRPAAMALVQANAALRSKGYGLLIHDGYRPWYVTWMFWEATPVAKRIFVANPAEGSKHNRGCAVDLTLYELATGKVVDMPSTYDETTDRAYADYVGGTSRQRWHRALLRRVMEAEHFTVNPTEWWHFDYADWKQYAIGNVPFEALK